MNNNLFYFSQVKLLKDILEAWKAEVEKKPPSMSIEEAYETLHLPKGVGGHDEAKIRKAYFRLAQKYHPDKNPEGRVSYMYHYWSFILSVNMCSSCVCRVDIMTTILFVVIFPIGYI